MSLTLMIAKLPEDADFSDPLFDNPPELGDPSELRQKSIAFAGDAVKVQQEDSIEIHQDGFGATLSFESNCIDIEGQGGDEMFEYLGKLAKHLDPEANVILCDG